MIPGMVGSHWPERSPTIREGTGWTLGGAGHACWKASRPWDSTCSRDPTSAPCPKTRWWSSFCSSAQGASLEWCGAAKRQRQDTRCSGPPGHRRPDLAKPGDKPSDKMCRLCLGHGYRGQTSAFCAIARPRQPTRPTHPQHEPRLRDLRHQLLPGPGWQH